MQSPRTSLPLPRRSWRTLLTAALLVGCAQPAPPSAERAQRDFVYDGVDHSWSSAGSVLKPLAIDAGDNTLSYEAWTSATNGFGPIERDHSNGEKKVNDGRALSIGGVAFEKGFGAHAPSSMTFDVAGRCRTFTASVGVDDEVGSRGSVVLQVYADGTQVYDSGEMHGADAAKVLSVDITGKSELRLVVTDAGDGAYYDHADWAGAKLLDCTPVAQVPERGQEIELPSGERVFSGVVNSSGTPQVTTIRNTGTSPLSVTGLTLTGRDASSFRLVNVPDLPLTVAPGGSVEVQTSFTPTRAGSLEAALRVTSNDADEPSLDVALYGLSARGEQGDLEPPLQQIVQTLGYAINVGSANLLLGTGSKPIGDEVLAPLFVKAGPGNVTMRPVARYSPDDLLPFGYYTPQTTGPVRQQVAVVARGAEQSLNPPIVAGGQQSFDPGSGPFGFYVGGTSYAAQNNYTQDQLNLGPIEHAVRVYPLKDRAGQPLANTYLVAFEPAVNGDYQDYVFVVSNVRPAPVAPTTVNWSSRAAALRGVSEAQGAAVNGRLYVFGGFDGGLRATTRSQVYDPATNRWADIAAMPEPLTHSAVAVDGSTVYVAGGFVGNHPGPQTNHVWKYDTTTDTWSPGPVLPAARGGGALARVGRELHFFGGVERSLSNTNVYLRDSADHWVLDLDGSGGWTGAAPMPNPRNHLAGITLDGRIYAIGGQHLGDEDAGNQTAVHMYDPASDTWAARADLPLPLGHVNASTTIWQGRIVVVAGVTQKSAEVADVLEYDAAANTWKALTPLPAARQSPVADVIGNELVVTGGSLPSGVKTTTWIGTR